MNIGNRKSKIGTAAALLVAALLSACGFHLRGAVQLAPSMQRLRVSSSDGASPLKRSVEQALQRSGAKIEENPGTGIAEIKLTGVSLAPVVRSVGANARVNEFVMVYHVDLEIDDGSGKTVYTKQPIEQSRTFTFDQTQAIGTGAEQEQISREMQRDMAQAVLRKIDSVQRHITQ